MDIAITTAAARQLKKIAPDVRRQVLAKLTAYAATGVGDVKALQGRVGFRLRSGDYRVIFTRTTECLTVIAIGHRRDIYD